MHRLRVLAKVMAMALLLSSCSANYPSSATNPQIVGLQIHFVQPIAFWAVDGTYFFDAYAIDADGAYHGITNAATWLSGDSSVLVPGSFPGGFRAVGPGTATILVRYEGAAASLSLAVGNRGLRPLPHLEISAVSVSGIGSQARSTVRRRETATGSIDVSAAATWSSSDPRVVTVQGGNVTAVGPGTAFVTASHNGLVAEYGLSVRPPSE
jgi:hypothetical protein